LKGSPSDAQGKGGLRFIRGSSPSLDHYKKASAEEVAAGSISSGEKHSIREGSRRSSLGPSPIKESPLKQGDRLFGIITSSAANRRGGSLERRSKGSCSSRETGRGGTVQYKEKDLRQEWTPAPAVYRKFFCSRGLPGRSCTRRMPRGLRGEIAPRIYTG